MKLTCPQTLSAYKGISCQGEMGLPSLWNTIPGTALMVEIFVTVVLLTKASG